jgi:hypothetical protein
MPLNMRKTCIHLVTFSEDSTLPSFLGSPYILLKGHWLTVDWTKKGLVIDSQTTKKRHGLKSIRIYI